MKDRCTVQNQSPKCEIPGCNHIAKVLFKDDPKDRETWLYATCDICYDYLCQKHFDEDDFGNVICDLCYQQIALNRQRELVSC